MADFFHMGGYGFYVWTAYGIAGVVLIGNVFFAKNKMKQIIRLIKSSKDIES